jgi:hypothetical protein
MPRRRNTRAEDRAHRIDYERELSRTAIQAEAARAVTEAASALKGDVAVA